MSTGLEEGQITIYFQLQVQGWQKSYNLNVNG